MTKVSQFSRGRVNGRRTVNPELRFQETTGDTDYFSQAAYPDLDRRIGDWDPSEQLIYSAGPLDAGLGAS